MKLRLKKLNQRGFDHVVALVVFVVLFAGVGTYLLVASRAATPTYYIESSSFKYCIGVGVANKAAFGPCNKNTAATISGSANSAIIKVDGKCLQNGPTTATSGVTFATCNGKIGAQYWSLNWPEIRTDALDPELCLGVNSAASQLGTWSCSSTPNGNWKEVVVKTSPAPLPAPVPVSATAPTNLPTLPAGKYCVSYEFYYEEPNTWGTQCVKDLQQMMYDIGEHKNYAGFVASEIYPPDGKYAYNTVAQVKAFQSQHGLTGSQSDGVVGENTWSKLCSYVNLTPGTWVYTNVGCKNGPFANNRYPLH